MDSTAEIHCKRGLVIACYFCFKYTFHKPGRRALTQALRPLRRPTSLEKHVKQTQIQTQYCVSSPENCWWPAFSADCSGRKRNEFRYEYFVSVSISVRPRQRLLRDRHIPSHLFATLLLAQRPTFITATFCIFTGYFLSSILQ